MDAYARGRATAHRLRDEGRNENADELDAFTDTVERFVRGEDVSGVTHPYFG